jgi:hypothetical protein
MCATESLRSEVVALELSRLPIESVDFLGAGVAKP